MSAPPHCALGADKCFGCKCLYWRENGSPFSLPQAFRASTADGYTQHELSSEIIANAAADGREIERVR